MLSGMDTAFATRDLRYVIAQVPVPIVAGTKTVTGTKTRLDAKTMAANAGLQDRYVTSVYTVAADWVEDGTNLAPAIDAVITVGGVAHRVLKTALDSLGVGLRLDLGAKFE